MSVFFVLACFLIVVDRDALLDNESYKEYFRGDRLGDVLDLVRDDPSLVTVVIALFSEEMIWALLAKVLSGFFSPELSVYLLSLLVNLFVLFGCLKTDKPIVAALLWVVIPVGFSIIGLFQLRQGFAYSLFLYGVYHHRPGKIGLLSCGIHTTLVIPYLFFLVDLLLRRTKSWMPGVLCAAALSVGMASAGGYFFEMFGGRRLATYDIGGGAESVNYVISSLIFLGFFLSSYVYHHRRNNVAERICSLAGIGVASFVIVSFYVFPLGTARIGYFLMLFALPLLASSGALKVSRCNEPRVAWGLMVVLFIGYQVIKSIATASYWSAWGGA